MPYGLKPDTIHAIQSVLAKFPQVEKAILYGSRAKGNYRIGSDIDLTLNGKDLDTALLLRIETDLDDLLLPYTIDLSLFRHIENPDLLAHIDRVGVNFYAI
jgi:predicted nucleotidyltransferase